MEHRTAGHRAGRHKQEKPGLLRSVLTSLSSALSKPSSSSSALGDNHDASMTFPGNSVGIACFQLRGDVRRDLLWPDLAVDGRVLLGVYHDSQERPKGRRVADGRTSSKQTADVGAVDSRNLPGCQHPAVAIGSHPHALRVATAQVRSVEEACLLLRRASCRARYLTPSRCLDPDYPPPIVPVAGGQGGAEVGALRAGAGAGGYEEQHEALGWHTVVRIVVRSSSDGCVRVLHAVQLAGYPSVRQASRRLGVKDGALNGILGPSSRDIALPLPETIARDLREDALAVERMLVEAASVERELKAGGRDASQKERCEKGRGEGVGNTSSSTSMSLDHSDENDIGLAAGIAEATRARVLPTSSKRGGLLAKVVGSLLFGNAKTFLVTSIPSRTRSYMTAAHALGLASRARSIVTACVRRRGVPQSAMGLQDADWERIDREEGISVRDQLVSDGDQAKMAALRLMRRMRPGTMETTPSSVGANKPRKSPEELGQVAALDHADLGKGSPHAPSSSGHGPHHGHAAADAHEGMPNNSRGIGGVDAAPSAAAAVASAAVLREQLRVRGGRSSAPDTNKPDRMGAGGAQSSNSSATPAPDYQMHGLRWFLSQDSADRMMRGGWYPEHTKQLDELVDALAKSISRHDRTPQGGDLSDGRGARGAVLPSSGSSIGSRGSDAGKPTGFLGGSSGTRKSNRPGEQAVAEVGIHTQQPTRADSDAQTPHGPAIPVETSSSYGSRNSPRDSFPGAYADQPSAILPAGGPVSVASEDEPHLSATRGTRGSSMSGSESTHGKGEQELDVVLKEAAYNAGIGLALGHQPQHRSPKSAAMRQIDAFLQEVVQGRTGRSNQERERPVAGSDQSPVPRAEGSGLHGFSLELTTSEPSTRDRRDDRDELQNRSILSPGGAGSFHALMDGLDDVFSVGVGDAGAQSGGATVVRPTSQAVQAGVQAQWPRGAAGWRGHGLRKVRLGGGGQVLAGDEPPPIGGSSHDTKTRQQSLEDKCRPGPPLLPAEHWPERPAETSGAIEHESAEKRTDRRVHPSSSRARDHRETTRGRSPAAAPGKPRTARSCSSTSPRPRSKSPDRRPITSSSHSGDQVPGDRRIGDAGDRAMSQAKGSRVDGSVNEAAASSPLASGNGDLRSAKSNPLNEGGMRPEARVFDVMSLLRGSSSTENRGAAGMRGRLPSGGSTHDAARCAHGTARLHSPDQIDQRPRGHSASKSPEQRAQLQSNAVCTGDRSAASSDPVVAASGSSQGTVSLLALADTTPSKFRRDLSPSTSPERHGPGKRTGRGEDDRGLASLLPARSRSSSRRAPSPDSVELQAGASDRSRAPRATARISSSSSSGGALRAGASRRRASPSLEVSEIIAEADLLLLRLGQAGREHTNTGSSLNGCDYTDARTKDDSQNDWPVTAGQASARALRKGAMEVRRSVARLRRALVAGQSCASKGLSYAPGVLSRSNSPPRAEVDRAWLCIKQAKRAAGELEAALKEGSRCRERLAAARRCERGMLAQMERLSICARRARARGQYAGERATAAKASAQLAEVEAEAARARYCAATAEADCITLANEARALRSVAGGQPLR